MTIKNALASLPVTDLAAASAWYAALIGRPADTTPMPELMEWCFEAGGWLQVYEGPQRAGGGSVTLAVDDIEAIARRLADLGVDAGARSNTSAVRTLMIKDPDGNSIAFAQALQEKMTPPRGE